MTAVRGNVRKHVFSNKVVGGITLSHEKHLKQGEEANISCVLFLRKGAHLKA